MSPPPPSSTLFPYTTLFRSEEPADLADLDPTEFTPNAPPSLEGLNSEVKQTRLYFGVDTFGTVLGGIRPWTNGDRKSTRLNSSHQIISYAVFCLKKKKSSKS